MSKGQMRKFNPWTLEEALFFIREMQIIINPLGFHCGLTGSVLLNGSSANDLDMIIYPNSTAKVDMTTLSDAFKDHGMKLLADRIVVLRVWKQQGSLDTKHVEAWVTTEGKKVDIFHLR